MAGKEPRLDIIDCKQKYDLLAERHGFSSRNQLMLEICEKFVLSDDSFRQQVSKQKMNETYRGATGEFCGFDANASEFLTGSLKEFEDFLDKNSERSFDRPLRAMRGGDPWSRDVTLAWFELSAGQWAAHQPTPLFATLICRPGPMGNTDVAVRRGTLELIPRIKGKAADRLTSQRVEIANIPRLEASELEEPVESDNSGQVHFDIRASGNRAVWDVRAENTGNAYIGKPRIPDDFCKAYNLADGDSIRAVFRIFIMDLEPLPEDIEEGEANRMSPVKSTAFVSVGSGGLDAWTRNLMLKRLAEKEKFGEGVCEVELCRDELFFDAVAGEGGEKKSDDKS